MKPVSPVLPDHDLVETKFVGEGYEDLPAVIDDQGAATTRWLLSPEEVEQVARQGYIYVRQIGVTARGLQPIWVGVEPPIKPIPATAERDGVLDADEIAAD